MLKSGQRKPQKIFFAPGYFAENTGFFNTLKNRLQSNREINFSIHIHKR